MLLIKMKKNNLIILTLLPILFALISFYYDSKIIYGVSLIQNNFLNYFFIGITYLSSKIIIFFLLTGLFLLYSEKRTWIIPLWFSLALSVLVSFLLKITVQRSRPYQQELISALSMLKENSHLIWDFSFPSFSAMFVFCAIPFISKEFPRFKYIWIIFAILVAFSRVYLGLHFLSDVIIGGTIGYLIGMIIVRKSYKRKQD